MITKTKVTVDDHKSNDFTQSLKRKIHTHIEGTFAKEENKLFTSSYHLKNIPIFVIVQLRLDRK